MSTIDSSQERRYMHPAVAATLIFMSGLFLIVLTLVLATRDDGGSTASAGTGTAQAHAATTAPAAAANPTPPATTVEASHHTVAAAATADNHTPYPAELPPLVAGVKQVRLGLKDVTLPIAPGVSFTAWTFAGGVPGPVIHVRQGQQVHV